MKKNVKQLLAEKLYSKNLVVFLGAGASRTHGQTKGIPSAKEIVEDLNKQKTYIDKKMTFPQAMFMVKENENSNELQKTLRSIFENNKTTLPVYELLAKMPISAFITTNYDELLENSLKNENKKFIPIIEEKDVSLWKNSDLPLIKIHGCISRPETIIAAEDQYRPLYSSKPLISAMLTTFLANKTLLFLGFSLADDDFKNFYQEIKIHLQDYMPKSYSIVDSCDPYHKCYWEKQGVEIIEQDLTEFVKDILTVKSNNNNFETLKISTQPSETKVIDTFLSTILEYVQNRSSDLEDVINQANQIVIDSLKNKPNLYALKNIWNQMHGGLKNAKSKNDAERKICNVIRQRNKHLENIRKQSSKVEKNDKILIYSQSKQVLEVLKNVPAETQRSCTLYICECRPKSHEAFQDALEIYKYLKEEKTQYNMTLIPDVAAGHFIKDINKVMLGTHAVFFKNKQILSFVNTCGSAMLYQLCSKNHKPLFVIADSFKFVHLKDSDEECISNDADEDIFIKSENLNGIALKNIGYDLIKWDDTIMTLLSDKKDIDKNK